MESGWGMRVEADFESFVVVRIDAETRDKTVNHQIDILIHIRLSSRKGLGRIEQQHLITITLLSLFVINNGDKSTVNINKR